MAALSSYVVIQMFAESLIEAIRNNIRTMNVTGHGPMHTTGQAEDSLGYRIDDNNLIIFSRWKYIWVLEDGRKPGKFPPIGDIEKWIGSKPVLSNISRRSLAFLIARKIAREGTELYRKGGNSGVISSVINLSYIHENLTKPLGQAYIDEVVSVLFRTPV